MLRRTLFVLACLVLATSSSADDIVIDSEVTWTEGRTIGVDDRLVIEADGQLIFDAPGDFLFVNGELEVSGLAAGVAELHILAGSLVIGEDASFLIGGRGLVFNNSIVQNLGRTLVDSAFVPDLVEVVGTLSNLPAGTFVNFGRLETVGGGHIRNLGLLVNVGRFHLRSDVIRSFPGLRVFSGGKFQNSGVVVNNQRMVVSDGGELTSSGTIRVRPDGGPSRFGFPAEGTLDIESGAVPAVFHGQLENYGGTVRLNRDLELGPNAQISNWGSITSDGSNVEILGVGALESCPYSSRSVGLAASVAFTAPQSCSGPDGDGDGIHDEVDPDGLNTVPRRTFDDLGIGGTTANQFTHGSIETLGGHAVRITKRVVRNPSLGRQRGIRIEGLPRVSATPATLRVCHTSDLSVTAGDDLLVTCGSLEVQVFEGEVEVETTSDGGRSYAISVPAGYTVFFDPETDRWEADADNPDALVVETDGAFFTLPPGGALRSPQTIHLVVKPESPQSSINVASNGVIAVAILGSEAFDVTAIARSTLRLGPGATSPAHRVGGHLGDVDTDGFVDLLSHYRTADVGLPPRATEVCVSGETLDGTTLQGCAPIETAP